MHRKTDSRSLSISQRLKAAASTAAAPVAVDVDEHLVPSSPDVSQPLRLRSIQEQEKQEKGSPL